MSGRMSGLGDLIRHIGAPLLKPDHGRKAELEDYDPGFDPAAEEAGEVVRLRLRRPILAGSLVVLVLVFGLLIWAAVASISGAVMAPGVVRVENNTKSIKHREGGVIRQILVREGQRVKRGQVLMRFDRVQGQAGVDIYQAAYDSALATIARFQAEAANAPDIRFPPELLARQNDPQVASLLVGQRGLFLSRMMLYRSQAQLLSEQASQLSTQIQGLQAQVGSVDSQSGLIGDELGGVKELASEGYAPKSRVLALQRNAAGLKGQRGSLVADIARARQAIGAQRMQIAQLDDRRQTDAAQGLRDAQDKLTDAAPKLRASTDNLEQTVVRAPVDGYVFNLTQFTEGGVAQPGETLLQIVPVNLPLLITGRVRTQDVADVRVGMKARITLTAFNPRTTPQIDGVVTLVSADAGQDEATKETFFTIQVRADPAELAKAGPKIRLSPGMPAMIAVVTGSRSILDYLLAPFTDAMRSAMRER